MNLHAIIVDSHDPLIPQCFGLAEGSQSHELARMNPGSENMLSSESVHMTQARKPQSVEFPPLSPLLHQDCGCAVFIDVICRKGFTHVLAGGWRSKERTSSALMFQIGIATAIHHQNDYGTMR